MDSPHPIVFERLQLASVRVTRRTEWTFAEISDTRGATAVAEITCGELSSHAISLLVEMVAILRGVSVFDEAQVPELVGATARGPERDRALATALSALRTAVVDLQAQHAGLSMTEALDGTSQAAIPLYANINRSLLTDRSPSAFATAAEKAVRKGYGTIKCAPFDEVRPDAPAEQILESARPGVERVAAVREAIGPDVRLLVDCHSRFKVDAAVRVAEKLARYEVGWFEEPLQPVTHAKELAQVAKRAPMPVAGGESGYGEGFFRSLLEGKAVSTIMPDVKYCGGVAEAFRAGKAASDLGGKVSLHSPSGPVSQLASAHVTAAVPGASPLEHAVGEAPWRKELLQPPEQIQGGQLTIPGGVGLGARLNPRTIQRYGRHWTPEG